jgi:hypothetical protein
MVLVFLLLGFTVHAVYGVHKINIDMPFKNIK